MSHPDANDAILRVCDEMLEWARGRHFEPQFMAGFRQAVAELKGRAKIILSRASAPSEPPPLGVKFVRVADELVAELSAEWSRPVRVRITHTKGNGLELVFQEWASAPPPGDP